MFYKIRAIADGLYYSCGQWEHSGRVGFDRKGRLFKNREAVSRHASSIRQRGENNPDVEIVTFELAEVSAVPLSAFERTRRR
jgi:hypothetical protein